MSEVFFNIASHWSFQEITTFPKNLYSVKIFFRLSLVCILLTDLNFWSSHLHLLEVRFRKAFKKKLTLQVLRESLGSFLWMQCLNNLWNLFVLAILHSINYKNLYTAMHYALLLGGLNSSISITLSPEHKF